MSKEFLRINQQRIKFLILFFAASPTAMLLIALLWGNNEVGRPLSEIIYAVFVFGVAFLIFNSLVFVIGGSREFNKRRKILNQENWTKVFDKFSFQNIVVDNGRLRYKEEAKKSVIEGFNAIAFVNLNDKALQFAFIANDKTHGKKKYNYECNFHLQFTKLDMKEDEIERTAMTYVREILSVGAKPSMRTGLSLKQTKTQA